MTHAQTARNVLGAHGIAAKVISIDPRLTKRGCSFGLSFDSFRKPEAISLLKRKGIYFGEVVGG